MNGDNPFLPRCDIGATLGQFCISRPPDLRFGQFKVRRTSIDVLWTRVSNFTTPCDILVPLWQILWHNVVLKNHLILGVFWPNWLYFDSLWSIFFNLKVVLSLFTHYLVSMQVTTSKTNNQCWCDTFYKMVRRANFTYFFVYICA